MYKSKVILRVLWIGRLSKFNSTLLLLKLPSTLPPLKRIILVESIMPLKLTTVSLFCEPYSKLLLYTTTLSGRLLEQAPNSTRNNKRTIRFFFFTFEKAFINP
jgi:hypothetical protein